MAERRYLPLAAIGAAASTLGGCKKADDAAGPGAKTVGEARALDEAAQMIDARRLPEGLPSWAQDYATEPAPAD
ncbi:hypothetical protein [uncultured Novosphingobium sp.]|uniref:hypothetical protein n=1 Tax=uncultured Novosphingobium sp. TaxID=292277 RepID=UPI003749FEB3